LLAFRRRDLSAPALRQQTPDAGADDGVRQEISFEQEIDHDD
jgi:hypothetical protein